MAEVYAEWNVGSHTVRKDTRVYRAAVFLFPKTRISSQDLVVVKIPLSSADYAPPDALVDACVAGDCVLYTGAGVSARSGFPGLQYFLENLLKWATTSALITKEAASTYYAGIEHNDLGAAADGIVGVLGAHGSALEEHLQTLFLGKATLSDAHQALSELPFCAGLTTNFDTLLEQSFASRNPRICTPRDSKILLEALHKREFFILKLYGDLSLPESVMMSPSQFEDAVRENEPFSRFMETLFFSKRFFLLAPAWKGLKII